RAVRAAAQLGDDVLLAVGRDAGQRLARDLDQDHRAIGHRDRALRELEARGDFPAWRRTLRRRHRPLPYLLALEVGLALRKERLHALAEILAAAELALEVALEIELLAEVVLAGAVHRLLD